LSSKISIVGANGFIGNNLSKKLCALNYKLELFTTSNPIIVDDQLSPSAINSNVIVWCASKVNPISADQNPELATEELAYWQKFLKIISRSDTENLRIFFLSSAGCTYTGNAALFSELDNAEGTNLYGKHKLKMESVLSQSKISSIILRVANVYGPNQPVGRGQGVIAEWVKSISRNEPITIYGDVHSFRDYLFIEDLSELIVSLIDTNVDNQKFNVGSGQATSLQELKDLFAEITKIEISSNENITRSFDRQGYVLDISKVTQMVGWKPKYNLKKGLQLCLK
jgi:UDP-glucose 4-epimerase